MPPNRAGVESMRKPRPISDSNRSGSAGLPWPGCPAGLRAPPRIAINPSTIPNNPKMKTP